MTRGIVFPAMLVVYTAITGLYDDLRAVECPPDPYGRPVRFVAFAPERLGGRKDGWERRPLPLEIEDDARLTARFVKINSHLLFPEAQFVLWHDGNHWLKGNPWELVDRYLTAGRAKSRDPDIAMFEHPSSRTLTDELQACVMLHKDDTAVMTDQVGRYIAEGCPQSPVFETGILLRRHNDRVRAFNHIWWQQVFSGSVRDQLSVVYAGWKASLLITVLPGKRTESAWVGVAGHGG